MKSHSRLITAVTGIGLILTVPSMAETLNEIRFYDNAGGGATGIVPSNTTSPGIIPASLPGAGNPGFVTGATGLLPTTASGTPHGLTREPLAGTGGSDRYTMTAAGSDFWGAADRGAYAFDNTSAGQSGDFSAVVRNVSIAGNPADYLAPNWGRTGLGARTDVNSSTSLTVNTLRETNPNGAIIQTARGVLGEGDNDNNRQVMAAGGVNGDVRTNAIWMGLHRYGGVVYSSWAPDVGGVPGVWSTTVGNAFGGNALSTGTLQIGLVHSAHTEDQPGGPNGNKVNSAVFDGFRVDNAGNNASFVSDMLHRGSFPGTNINTTPALSVMGGNKVGGTSAGYIDELGLGVSFEGKRWKVEVVAPATQGLHMDIYTGMNLASQAGWEGILDGSTPKLYSGKVTHDATVPTGVYWNKDNGNYPAAWQLAGHFPNNGPAGAGEDNYSARATGQIFLSVGDYKFRDGSDDYSFLAINGQTLIDDNNWTSVDGTQNGGSPTGSFSATQDGWYDIDFRMAEGGGGDNQALYWDYAPNNVNDPAAGGIHGGNAGFQEGAGALSPSALVPDGFLRSFETISLLEGNAATNGQIFTDANGNQITLPVGDSIVRFTDIASNSFSPALYQTLTVPEPGSAGLIALGAAGFLVRRRRR